jgi:hypothetical protein
VAQPSTGQALENHKFHGLWPREVSTTFSQSGRTEIPRPMAQRSKIGTSTYRSFHYSSFLVLFFSRWLFKLFYSTHKKGLNRRKKTEAMMKPSAGRSRTSDACLTPQHGLPPLRPRSRTQSRQNLINTCSSARVISERQPQLCEVQSWSHACSREQCSSNQARPSVSRAFFLVTSITIHGSPQNSTTEQPSSSDPFLGAARSCGPESALIVPA